MTSKVRGSERQLIKIDDIRLLLGDNIIKSVRSCDVTNLIKGYFYLIDFHRAEGKSSSDLYSNDVPVAMGNCLAQVTDLGSLLPEEDKTCLISGPKKELNPTGKTLVEPFPKNTKQPKRI